MATIDFEINKRLDVLWNDKRYKSSIQDVKEEGLLIATPLMAGMYLPLHRGDSFTVIYFKDDKEIYEFEGLVTGRVIEGKLQLIMLEYPRSIKQIQRREYVRVDISHPVKFVKTQLEAELKYCDMQLDNDKGTSAMLVDLSGGGLKLKTTEKIEANHFLSIDIELMEKRIRAHGKVVRVVVDENGNYVCGVLFVNMNERVRDRLIQLIFEIMRKQIKTS